MQLILSKIIGWFVSKITVPFAIFWAGGKHKELKNTQEVIKNVKKAHTAGSNSDHDDKLLDKYK